MGAQSQSPRSGGGGQNHERPTDARSGPRGRPSIQRGQEAAPATSWQAAASWLDDRDGADGAPDVGVDLVNLGFIGAALRRGKRWWSAWPSSVCSRCGRMGCAAARPQASTTLLLDVGPEGQPGTAILNDQVVAHSRGVARTALEMLGLQEDIEAFQATYHASVVTDRVLLITVNAPSDEKRCDGRMRSPPPSLRSEPAGLKKQRGCSSPPWTMSLFKVSKSRGDHAISVERPGTGHRCLKRLSSTVCAQRERVPRASWSR